MFRALIAVPVLGIAGMTTGCATITRGTTEVLVVETEPPGANVSISPEGRTCRSPCSVELKRKRDYVIDIDRPGYEPARVNVVSEISGAGAAGMAGNVLLGGLIGAGVDAATGATKKLTPNPVRLNLVKLEGTAPAEFKPVSAQLSAPVPVSSGAPATPAAATPMPAH